MNRGHASQALELLAGAAQYDRGDTEARYTRGCAYLLTGQIDLALAEFQAVVNLKNYWPPDLMIPLAKVGVARAHLRLHEGQKASAAYQDFFKLWKDADPDISVLIAAKSEYAKLK
jgi:eukaryotic-like serine/threonine-protein kinase